ncbi:hypothetical protein NPIL_263361 [Nephila pilipes]|uniref:Uncharacterized protein n=1 Tax=Nephila pilipes TaxID=299642 RepID=A0A8X6QY12_NEPPI|nr:hypothetical protein NPIL_263361 [Nephila pilipes]
MQAAAETPNKRPLRLEYMNLVCLVLNLAQSLQSPFRSVGLTTPKFTFKTIPFIYDHSGKNFSQLTAGIGLQRGYGWKHTSYKRCEAPSLHSTASYVRCIILFVISTIQLLVCSGK